MNTIKVKGIVIRSLDYKETSKIVYCFTPLGRLSVRALGSKKFKNKNFNFQEILSYVEMEITDQEFPSLIDYNLISDFRNIKDDLKSFLWMGYLCEFLNKIPIDSPSNRVFNYLLNGLMKIKNNKDAMAFTVITLLKFTSLFGISPNFKQCALCNNSPCFISVKHGGGVCEIHKTSDAYNLNNLHRLYNLDINSDDIYNVLENELNECFKFVTEFYKYHLDMEFKSQNSLIF